MTRRQQDVQSGAFAPSPVRTPVDQVRLRILEGIISGELRPGDRLPSEVEQARGFKVGRSTVREALRSLVEMGLLSTAQGRGGGSFVNNFDSVPVERNLKDAMELLLHFDAINVRELLEARGVLEGTCARLAARRRGDDELARMAEVLDQAGRTELSAEEWLQLDIEFHRAVALSGDNRVLIVPLAALHAVVQPRLNEAIMPLLDREEVNAQHRAIYEAIGAGDSEAAGAAVEAHLTSLEQLYRRAGLL
ncbi:MAG: FCD domain-containing protein [Actinobacteria bacterium]|nr:FCD domain-containing protein [Actinomycetota bacterium]